MRAYDSKHALLTVTFRPACTRPRYRTKYQCDRSGYVCVDAPLKRALTHSSTQKTDVLAARSALTAPQAYATVLQPDLPLQAKTACTALISPLQKRCCLSCSKDKQGIISRGHRRTWMLRGWLRIVCCSTFTSPGLRPDSPNQWSLSMGKPWM